MPETSLASLVDFPIFFVAGESFRNDYEAMQDATRAPKDGKKRILVVDDTESVADLMREMLISFGYEAEISLFVEPALATYAPGKYDLVITDYLMPKMNGLEFATAMKQKSPGQRVLLITGSTFPMTEINPRQLPVEATLQKPFSVEEFQQSVNDVLALPPILFNPAVAQPQSRPQMRAS